MSAALMGFVSVFVSNELWPIFVGYAFWLIGSLFVAPTRGRIAALELHFGSKGAAPSFIEQLKKATPAGQKH